MTAPLIQGASGVEGEKLTYASTNENNKEIYRSLGETTKDLIYEALKSSI